MKDNIKIDLKQTESEDVDCIQLSKYTLQW
jgi:hypothetical protein